jgi:hypothetical protein
MKRLLEISRSVLTPFFRSSRLLILIVFFVAGLSGCTSSRHQTVFMQGSITARTRPHETARLEPLTRSRWFSQEQQGKQSS